MQGGDIVNIATEFTIGNTKVKIATDYCDTKTAADTERTLAAIVICAKEHFRAAERTAKNER